MHLRGKLGFINFAFFGIISHGVPTTSVTFCKFSRCCIGRRCMDLAMCTPSASAMRLSPDLSAPCSRTPAVFECLLRQAWHFPVDLLTRLDHFSSVWPSFDGAVVRNLILYRFSNQEACQTIRAIIGSLMLISIFSVPVIVLSDSQPQSHPCWP